MPGQRFVPSHLPHVSFPVDPHALQTPTSTLANRFSDASPARSRTRTCVSWARVAQQPQAQNPRPSPSLSPRSLAAPRRDRRCARALSPSSPVALIGAPARASLSASRALWLDLARMISDVEFKLAFKFDDPGPDADARAFCSAKCNPRLGTRAIGAVASSRSRWSDPSVVVQSSWLTGSFPCCGDSPPSNSDLPFLPESLHSNLLPSRPFFLSDELQIERALGRPEANSSPRS
eukprot:3042844-Rhodomonas_salina.1